MKSWLTGKDPDEKTEGKRRKGQERIRWLDTITNLMDTNLSEVCETVEDRGAWRVAVHGFAKSWTRLSDWKITTATMATIFLVCFFFKDGSYCSPQRVHQNTFPPCLVRVRGRPQASPVSLWTPSNDPLTMMWSICHQHKECPGRSAYICNLKILYLLLITWKLNERNVCDKRKSPWELFFFFSYGRPFWLKRKQKKSFTAHLDSLNGWYSVFRNPISGAFYARPPRRCLRRGPRSRPLFSSGGTPACRHSPSRPLSLPSQRWVSLNDRSLPDTVHLPGIYSPSKLDVG